MRERGSVLALLPVAVLIFIGLGTIAVDAGVAFLGEREVANLAGAIANDAAAEAIDVEWYQRTGLLQIDPARAHEIAVAAVARSGLDHLRGLTVDTDVVGDDVVVVRVRARVRSLFARALPQGLEEREVAASSEATARRG